MNDMFTETEIANVKVGLNQLGCGLCYCKDANDVEDFKMFMRGMNVGTRMAGLFGFETDEELTPEKPKKKVMSQEERDRRNARRRQLYAEKKRAAWREKYFGYKY